MSSSLAPPPPRDEREVHSFAQAEDGTKLFVRTVAKEDAAVTAMFCDGILCDGFIWKYLWGRVQSRLSASHFHYRGHGRSGNPVDPERIDIRAHALDLSAVRKHVGDPGCVLFGHSMGCQVILEGYRVAPENIRGLVLLCGSFGRVTSTFRGGPVLDLLLPRVIDAVVKAPDVARAIWSRLPKELCLKLALRSGEVDAERINPNDFLPYLEHIAHVDFPMFLQMLRAAGDHSAGDLLPDIKVPTLIVAGERDSFTPPYLSEWMAKTIPGAELLILKGGSHVAPIEQPDILGEAVDRFIDERVMTPG